MLVRPAVPAGEDLGFLPGGVDEKLMPYLRPALDCAERSVEGGAAAVERLRQTSQLELNALVGGDHFP